MTDLPRLVWPAPALLAWFAAWVLYWALRQVGQGAMLAFVAATALGVATSLAGHNWWRRLIIAAGFPVSLLLSGAAALPPWAWFVLLVLLALIYPLNAWRDAPLFPTPAMALQALPANVPLRDGARVLDAGCGLGHALVALRAAYPSAQLHGIEWSWPLVACCAMRCPWARVRQGDIWQADWSGFDMVYLFQRPESLPRAVEQAGAQMHAGAWLVSLEFEARELVADLRLEALDARPVWLYRVPFTRLDRHEAPAEHK